MLTADDCDDSDNTDTLLSGDCDQDGVMNIVDCDDFDSTDSALSGDCDQDGIPANDDCDDYDPTQFDTFVALQSWQVDEDGDGNNDLELIYDYDGFQNPISVQYDTNMDGIVDGDYCSQTLTGSVIAEVECVQTESNINGNQDVSSIETDTLSYDSVGQYLGRIYAFELTHLDYYGQSTNTTYVSLTTTVFDAQNAQIGRTVNETVWYNGNIEETSVSIYNADNNLLTRYVDNGLATPITYLERTYYSDGSLESSCSSEDYGHNGIYEYYYCQYYDEWGNYIGFYYSDNRDTESLTYEYNADGQLLSRQSNNYNYWSHTEGTSDTVYTYDANGYLLNINSSYTICDYDYGVCETTTTVDTYTYDSSQNLTMIVSVETTDYSSGIYYSFRYYTYDLNNNQLTESYDHNGDGVIDWHVDYAYDASNNLVSEEYDTNNDSILDYGSYYAYDAYGNQILSEFDSDGDGQINSGRYYVYDANGHQLQDEYDSNGDGNINNGSYRSYNSDGTLASETHDANGDGQMDRSKTYSYDGNGNEMLYEYDTDGDGQANQIRIQSFDTNGNQTLLETDSNGDGLIESGEYWTYDSNNNLVYSAQDTDGDGQMNYAEEMTYTIGQCGLWWYATFCLAKSSSVMLNQPQHGRLPRFEIRLPYCI